MLNALIKGTAESGAMSPIQNIDSFIDWRSHTEKAARIPKRTEIDVPAIPQSIVKGYMVMIIIMSLEKFIIKSNLGLYGSCGGNKW